MHVKLKSEHFDIGLNHIVLLSPVNCNAVERTSTITNASVRIYDLSNEPDVDLNENGIIDSSEILDVDDYNSKI